MTAHELAEVIHELVPVVIGGAGIALAAWSRWVDHKNRKAYFRQKIYDRQVEGCGVLVEAIVRLCKSAELNIDPPDDEPNEIDNSRNRLREKTAKPYEELLDARNKWTVYLPNEVNSAISHFITMFNALSFPVSITRSFPKAFAISGSPSLALDLAYREVINAVRSFLGIDTLSQENMALLGAQLKPKTFP